MVSPLFLANRPQRQPETFLADHFLMPAIAASPLKGLTIQPLTPASLPRCFMLGLLSVVSMMIEMVFPIV